jgi:hypothetical protein
MTRYSIVAVAALLLAGPVVAQQVDGEEAQPQRRVVQRAPNPGRPPMGGPWMGRMYDMIAQRLQLNEEQRARFDELTAESRAQMQEMQERWQSVREAQESGDRELAEQLRAEIMSQPNPMESMQGALEQLEPYLDDDQADRLYTMRDRWERGQRMREQYRLVTEDLPQSLNLSEEQQSKFDELLQAGRERMRDQWREMRPMMEEIRKAEEAGDTEVAAELRADMEASMPQPEELIDAFLTELEPTLDQAQKQQLAAFREQLRVDYGVGQPSKVDLRTVLRAARRLRLRAEQKDALREIEREVKQSQRTIRRDDRDGQQALAEVTRGKIVAMLDADQQEQFTKYLERRARR